MNKTSAQLDLRSRELRKVIIGMLESAGRGHIASALSVMEIVRVLYDDILQYKPSEPDWSDRDRFILSKGHGCMALYAILADKGFFPEAELKEFCKPDGMLGGHPEFPRVPGVEFSTGALGHGLPVGVGMAIAARQSGQNHRVFVVLGDGESNEGSVWEAALSAAQHGLDNLVVLVDYNKQQSYSTTADVIDLEPFADKWKAFRFATREVDGHDVSQLKDVLSSVPFEPGRPSAVICHTIKGRGFSFVEQDLSWHHKNRISDDEITSLIAELRLDE